MNLKDKKFVQILLVALIIVFGVASIYLSNQKRKADLAYNTQISDNADLKNRIHSEQEALNKEAYNDALNNPDKHIRMNVRQVQATNDASKITDKLFDILLTYDSSEVYNSRKDKAKKYVTESVLKSKDLFQSDVIDGTHYVDDSGLSSQYDSAKISFGLLEGDDLPVTISATYISGFKGENKATSSDIYVGTYSYTQKKFTKLEMLNNLFRGNESVDNE